MKLIQQPKGSKLCGQAVVAMLLDITLEEAIERIEHTHSTKIKELLEVIKHQYILQENKLTRISSKNPIPPFCILRIRWSETRYHRYSHWVIQKDGIVYDPLSDEPISLLSVEYNLASGNLGRLTSFLELQEKRIKVLYSPIKGIGK